MRRGIGLMKMPPNGRARLVDGLHLTAPPSPGRQGAAASGSARVRSRSFGEPLPAVHTRGNRFRLARSRFIRVSTLRATRSAGEPEVASWNGRQGWRAFWQRSSLPRATNTRPHSISQRPLLVRVKDGRRLNPAWWRLSPTGDEERIHRCNRCKIGSKPQTSARYAPGGDAMAI